MKKYLFNKATLSLIVLSLALFSWSCFSEKEANNRLSGASNNESVPSEDESIDEEVLEEELADADAEEESNYEQLAEEVTENTIKKPVESIDENLEPTIMEIKRALNRGQYRKVIALSEQDDSDPSQYYRGIAYFAMMQQIQKYDEDEREIYLNEALNLLKKIGSQSSNLSYRARARLWYGVALHIAYVDLSNKKKAVKTFHSFEITELKDTPYYNDAIYYNGLIHLQMSWVAASRHYFTKLENADQIDNLVFDFNENRYLSVGEASEKGLDQLEEKLNR